MLRVTGVMWSTDPWVLGRDGQGCDGNGRRVLR